MVVWKFLATHKILANDFLQTLVKTLTWDWFGDCVMFFNKFLFLYESIDSIRCHD